MSGPTAVGPTSRHPPVGCQAPRAAVPSSIFLDTSQAKRAIYEKGFFLSGPMAVGPTSRHPLDAFPQPRAENITAYFFDPSHARRSIPSWKRCFLNDRRFFRGFCVQVLRKPWVAALVNGGCAVARLEDARPATDGWHLMLQADTVQAHPFALAQAVPHFKHKVWLRSQLSDLPVHDQPFADGLLAAGIAVMSTAEAVPTYTAQQLCDTCYTCPAEGDAGSLLRTPPRSRRPRSLAGGGTCQQVPEVW